MFFVYVIVSEVNGLRFYVGLTGNVEERIKQHNSGRTRSTKGFVPWELFYAEVFKTRQEAREREKYLKSGSSKESIKRKWSRSSAG